MKPLLLFILFGFYLLPPTSFAGGYPGFPELKPTFCALLDKKEADKLPVPWHKYRDFIKVCPR